MVPCRSLMVSLGILFLVGSRVQRARFVELGSQERKSIGVSPRTDRRSQSSCEDKKRREKRQTQARIGQEGRPLTSAALGSVASVEDMLIELFRTMRSRSTMNPAAENPISRYLVRRSEHESRKHGGLRRKTKVSRQQHFLSPSKTSPHPPLSSPQAGSAPEQPDTHGFATRWMGPDVPRSDNSSLFLVVDDAGKESRTAKEGKIWEERWWSGWSVGREK